jgi:hypothetical protein
VCLLIIRVTNALTQVVECSFLKMLSFMNFNFPIHLYFLIHNPVLIMLQLYIHQMLFFLMITQSPLVSPQTCLPLISFSPASSNTPHMTPSGCQSPLPMSASTQTATPASSTSLDFASPVVPPIVTDSRVISDHNNHPMVTRGKTGNLCKLSTKL